LEAKRLEVRGERLKARDEGKDDAAAIVVLRCCGLEGLQSRTTEKE
jgi:hypothetical protein